jgi:hypothetical protein
MQSPHAARAYQTHLATPARRPPRLGQVTTHSRAPDTGIRRVRARMGARSPGNDEYPGPEHGGGQPTPGPEGHERPEHQGEQGSGHTGPAGPGHQRRAPGQRPESARHPATSRAPAPHHAAETTGATHSTPRSAPSAAAGKAPATPPAPARAPITLSRATTPTAAAPAATTPAPATSAPAATTPQLAGGSHPALTNGPPHAARDPRHARSRGARHAAPVAFSPGAVAPVAAIPFTPAHTARARRSQRAAHGPPAPSRRPSPITRIVGVVPTFVWILIGVLLALALAIRSRLAAASRR